MVASRALQPLLAKLPTLQRGYRPPPLLPFGVPQSSFSEACPPPKDSTPFEREELVLPEVVATPPRHSCCPTAVPEGLVTVDWLHPTIDQLSSPICLIVPSLTGSSDSSYVRRLSAKLREAGVRVACYHPRGLGGNPLISRFLYSAGYTEDLRRVVAHARGRYPDAPMLAVGYSLGGSVLAKFVAEEGAGCALAGAAAMAAPLDYVAVDRWLASTWLGAFCDRCVIVPSVRRVLRHWPHKRRRGGGADASAPEASASAAASAAAEVPRRVGVEAAEEAGGDDREEPMDIDAAVRATTIRGIDDALVAPMMGYGRGGADAYYVGASAAPLLSQVRVPMLVVFAENDPLGPPATLGRDAVVAAATAPGDGAAPLVLATTPEGGHSLVWPEGWLADGTWASELLVEWVCAVTDHPKRTAG